MGKLLKATVPKFTVVIDPLLPNSPRCPHFPGIRESQEKEPARDICEFAMFGNHLFKSQPALELVHFNLVTNKNKEAKLAGDTKPFS